MRVTGKRYTEDFRSDAVNLVRRGDRSFKQIESEAFNAYSWFVFVYIPCIPLRRHPCCRSPQ